MWTEEKARKIRAMLIDLANNEEPCPCIDCLLRNRQMSGMVAMANWMINADPQNDRTEEELTKLAAKARAGEKVHFSLGVG